MNNANDIFMKRKEEVDFYLKRLEYIDFSINNKCDDMIFNDEFLKILKSSFILLLYNLVEASISTAIDDIYHTIRNENYKYENVIPEIRRIWSNNKLELNNSNKHHEEIIDQIINDIIKLDNKKIGISGNLDARKIRKICKKHKISIKAIDGTSLHDIVKKRNALAHGSDSFTDCTRDLSVKDLDIIRENVVSFIHSILRDMKQYHDNKLFLYNT